MPDVRFAWDAALVAVRREACPRAKWDQVARAWAMTEADAEAFLTAVHARLAYARYSTQVAVDDVRWLVGFVQGAPCRFE
jgi:hypothetical protein